MSYRIKFYDYELILTPKPDLRWMYVEVSSVCNFSCEFCFRHGFEEEFGFIDLKGIKLISSQLKDFPELEGIVIGGIGEPLCHPEFPKILQAFKNFSNLKVILATNGSLLSKDICELLIETGVNKLIVSYDAGEPGHPEEHVIQNLLLLLECKKRFRAKRPLLGIECVIHRGNLERIPKVIELVKKVQAEEVMFTHLLPCKGELDDAVLYPDEKAERKFFEILKNCDISGGIRVLTPNFKFLTERHCNFVEKRAVVIRWDGLISPCYRFLHTGKERVLGQEKRIHSYGFGNIYEKSLLDAWCSLEYALFRYRVKNALFPSCHDCNFREGCQFIESTETDCWGNSPSCADCLWWRQIIICP